MSYIHCVSHPLPLPSTPNIKFSEIGFSFLIAGIILFISHM